MRHPARHPPLRPLDGRRGVQALAGDRRDTYGGDAARALDRGGHRAELLARLKALPGFGEQKAQIFAALLGKQLGVRPEGWEQAVGAYAEDGSYRSVADVVDADSLQKVRDFKKAAEGGRAGRGLSAMAARDTADAGSPAAAPRVRDVRHDATG